MKNIKQQYEKVCKEYVEEFCKKQDLEFDYFVCDLVGDVSSYSSTYFFNFQDIVWDINSNQKKGRIIDWYWESLENTENAINYYSWTKLNQS